MHRAQIVTHSEPFGNLDYLIVGVRMPLPDAIAVPMLEQLASGGFFYGGHYIVEFDPDSLWYETSLTIAALALKWGTKTEYHVFQHFPKEAIDGLVRLGVDAQKLEKEGLLRIIDNYTGTLEYEKKKKKSGDKPDLFDTGKPLDAVRGKKNWTERARAGYSDEEKRWLHIDDNTSIFLQYNDEETLVDCWRTGQLPFAIRARETPHFLAFVKGVGSGSFYTKFEALCDGIIDVKAQEEGGRIENYIRIRMIRGKKFDSRWHRLELMDNGEVVLQAARSEESRRLAAIMFTDMVGYTALGQRNEPLSLALVEEQRELVRPILGTHNGREVKTMGDAFLVEFPNALDAVRCAYEIQKAVKESNISRPEEKRIHLRVGLHLGDVVESAGDISGDAVNIASRIEPLAEVGGVCLTRQVYDQVQNKIEIPLINIGQQALKNISAPIEVFKMTMPWESKSVDRNPSSIEMQRVAVLPFVNMSPDSSDEYFADGLTEEMIARLSRLSGLDVIARTSIMNYKNKEKSASQIGKELQAGALLEGSVRKAGNRIRVTVQMIDSNSEGHLWAESYDRNLDDIFAVQGEIAEKVARNLEVHLASREKTDLERKPTENMEAYMLYLKGHELWSQYTLPAFKEGLKYFERAVQLDPKFALAHAGMAQCYSLMGDTGYLPQVEAISKAEAAAKVAVGLDERLPEAHIALAPPRYHRYDWQGADKELLRAMELRPSYPLAHSWHGVILRVTGKLDDALVEYRRGAELDPLSPLMSRFLQHVLYQMRLYDEAVEQTKRTLELDPSGRGIHGILGYVYLQESKFDEAIEDFKTVISIVGQDNLGAQSQLGVAYAMAGRRDEARRIIQDLENASSKTYVAPEFPAIIYLMLDEREKAFQLFGKAIDDYCSYWVDELKVDPLFDPYRSDERFTALLRRIHLA